MGHSAPPGTSKTARKNHSNAVLALRGALEGHDYEVSSFLLGLAEVHDIKWVRAATQELIALRAG